MKPLYWKCTDVVYDAKTDYYNVVVHLPFKLTVGEWFTFCHRYELDGKTWQIFVDICHDGQGACNQVHDSNYARGSCKFIGVQSATLSDRLVFEKRLMAAKSISLEIWSKNYVVHVMQELEETKKRLALLEQKMESLLDLD